MKQIIETPCKVCNKRFNTTPWKISHGEGKTCSNECRHVWQKTALKGEKSALWNGGFYFKIGRNGEKTYKYIKSPDHPFRNNLGYVAEHRLVMEKKIGRYLTKEEVVHHINENKSDNRIKNLKLIESNRSHMKEHARKISCICGEKAISLGLCMVHYHRYREHGVLDFGPRKRRKSV